MRSQADRQRSVYTTLGASNHTDNGREQLDYYATDPLAAELLLEKESFSSIIWECAVGGGHLAEVFKRNGHRVICSDIIDRGYATTHILDFLNCYPSFPLDVDIITNPPYKYAKQFILKALDCVKDGYKVAMFLRLQFLEGKSRKELFEKYPPKTVYISRGRIKCAMNGEFDKFPHSAIAYAWFVWEKGYTGKTIIDWIN